MKNIFSIKGIGDYLLQVSLIILSLLIATGVNRCNENRKDDRKLAVYLAAIEEDLEQELSTLASNLHDTEADYADLRRSIRASKHPDADSLQLSLNRGLIVLMRGVYRSFAPTTYEIMVESGDALLINDLAYRNALASFVDFRKNYIRADLWNHDAKVLETAEKISPYLDFDCARQTRGNLSCVTDPEGYRNEAANIYATLHRTVELRLFHLNIFQNITEKVLQMTRDKQNS